MSELESPFSEINKSDKKEKIDIAIALVVVLLFGVGITQFIPSLSFIPMSNDTSQAMSADSMKKDISPRFSSGMSIEANEDTGNDTEEIETHEATSQTSLEVNPNLLPPENKTTTPRDSLVSVVQIKEDVSTGIIETIESDKQEIIDSVKTKIQKENIIQDSVVDSPLPAKTKNKESGNSNPVSVQKITQPVPQKANISQRIGQTERIGQTIFMGMGDIDCIIMVGVFSDSRNSDRIISLLQKDGYSTFQSPYNNLIRTGVKLYCDPIETKEILKIIQANYNPNAYIVRKSSN